MGMPKLYWIVFSASAAPPPGYLLASPEKYAVLMRFSPKPGIVTHRSRGSDNMPTFLPTGSSVTTISVSVRAGPYSPGRRSIPISKKLIRSCCWYCTCGSGSFADAGAESPAPGCRLAMIAGNGAPLCTGMEAASVRAAP